MTLIEIEAEAAAAIGADIALGICRDWLRQQPSNCVLYRRLWQRTTPLSDSYQRHLWALADSDEGYAARPQEEHEAAFVATFTDLEEEGRHLARCGIHDRGVLAVPDWIDWQCFLADSYVRGKARQHGMPVHIATLASAVMRGALRDEASDQYVAAHTGNTTRQ